MDGLKLKILKWVEIEIELSPDPPKFTSAQMGWAQMGWVLTYSV